MDYFEFEDLLQEALDEVMEPVDDSSLLADWSHKLFNQGAHLLFSTALLKFAEKYTMDGVGK